VVPSDEQRVLELCDELLAGSDPATTPATELLGAQFDRGEINPDGSPRMDGMFHRAHQGGRGAAGADFEDLVADLFGRRRRPRQTKGNSVTYAVRVPFLEAARGGVQRVRLHDGKTVEVNVPEATDDGDSLRLKGRGMPGANGGPAGDAFVEVQVDPHPYFVRDGLDIRIDVPITLAEAVLGAKINIPTVRGTVAVTVPEGSSSGSVLRLKARGLSKAGSQGDEFVRLMIHLPENGDAKLKEFVREWTKQGDYDPRGKVGFK